MPTFESFFSKVTYCPLTGTEAAGPLALGPLPLDVEARAGRIRPPRPRWVRRERTPLPDETSGVTAITPCAKWMRRFLNCSSAKRLRRLLMVTDIRSGKAEMDSGREKMQLGVRPA